MKLKIGLESDAEFYIGLGLFAAGLAFIYPPLALIVMGLTAMFVRPYLLDDKEESPKQHDA